MKRSTFNYVKQILKDYPNIDKHIQLREEELRYPYRESDINEDIKSNGQTDRMTNMLITIDQDRRLAALERNKRVIEHNLHMADEDTQTIIKELYIARYPKYTMSGLVNQMMVECGRSKAFKLRDEFFENVADDLGLDK
ncbi:transcriptional regulator [Aerococcaceae bacterium WGS1372]